MKAIPITRRQQLNNFVNPLEGLGYSPRTILERGGISKWAYGKPDDWVPVRFSSLAMKLGAQAAGEDRYGFWIAKQTPISQMPLVGTSLSHAVTVYDALNVLCRGIVNLYKGLPLWLERQEDDFWLCRGVPAGAEGADRLIEQYVLLKMVQVVRLGFGVDWKPAKIQVRARNLTTIENVETFGSCTILSGQQKTAIAIPASMINQPIASFGNGFIQAAKTTPAEPEPTRDFVGSLREIIASHLSEGALSIETSAEIAGVSSRTMKRWLGKNGLTYRTVIDQARLTAATNLLKNSGLKMDEIAYQLGYANPTHFYRAFQRLSGMTPGEFRQLEQQRCTTAHTEVTMSSESQMELF